MSVCLHLLRGCSGFHHGRWLLRPFRRSVAFRRLSSGNRISRSLQESYRLLQLPAEGHSSPAQVRDAYLRLAKLYHPDSGEATADAALFARIEEAYRTVLTHQSKTRPQEGATQEEEEEEAARRAAPQHRHYLSYEGVGSGTPSQRERQYRQIRVDRAAEQVLSYRQREHERAAAAEGALVERDTRQRSRKIKITQAVERLVEDLIQESMARGDFRNLGGAGKPLNKFQHNPYADPMTHNLNRILIDNGYQPPWVVTQRDIREGAARLRGRLLDGRARLADPMTLAEQEQWEGLCASMEEELKKLNKMVDNYNLIVPMLGMQMVHFSMARETERAQRGAERRRADLLGVREAERQRRKEEKKKTDSAAKTRRKTSGLLTWMQRLLRL
ncbi:PREDICTED: dnaJ homolog subfamily C member 28 [Cyprinodon variegatus]|uniref:DnaJ (Hsp40) homolog, subfamily C, member 28 n=1 Tax=Cyprinodon variegatus TaxID=28743 RepID=A0A3Q2DYA4_CYPVA|nr:PREDICTED: dnaJ homolog subfamily C member 28 [Cyprinodon variegatus]